MSNDLQKHAKSIADKSGFPLQIRLANIASSSQRWELFLEEHPWHSKRTNSSGFIDLIIRKSEVTLQTLFLIECKRVQDKQWVFLIPETTSCLRSNTRFWRSMHHLSEWNIFDWYDSQIEPQSFESKFCVMEGEHGRRDLLDRLSFELLESLDEFTSQEKTLIDKQATPGTHFHRIYIPLIVTTAKLIVSHFEPSSIPLKEGSLPSDARFEEVPFVRFRKTLTTHITSPRVQTISEAHQTAERTVFIVNSEGFENFLNSFRIRSC
jgi:hypothetical protein